MLQKRIEKVHPRRQLTAEEKKRLAKLERIADKLKRGENVQNRQIQTWLCEYEYAQIEAEWQEQQTTPKDTERTDFTPIRPQSPLPNQRDSREKR